MAYVSVRVNIWDQQFRPVSNLRSYTLLLGQPAWKQGWQHDSIVTRCLHAGEEPGLPSLSHKDICIRGFLLDM